MSASNYLENAIVNHLLRNTALASPTNVYVALYTSNPGEDNSGTEVSALGYARQLCTFDAPSNGVTQNTSAITFGPAGASWSTVTHFAIFDALTTGNMLLYDALAASKVIATNDEVKFNIGQLVASVT